MESRRCWCAVVVQGERERDEHFDFVEREKAREGGSLNFSGSFLSFSI